MAYGIIQNGAVANAVEASAAFAKSQGWILLPDGVGIGWLYDGKTFKAPPTLPATLGPPIITYKADVWRRSTSQQAAAIDTELTKLDVRMRRLWDDAQYLDHSTEEFALLKQTMVVAFGQPEADRILAPSNV